jgi:hypothetical protein
MISRSWPASFRLLDRHFLRLYGALSNDERRPLPLEALPIALTAAFYGDGTKQMQWNAFVSKNKLYIEPITLQEVIAGIEAFVIPVLPSPAAKNLPVLQWEPGGPWRRI